MTPPINSEMLTGSTNMTQAAISHGVIPIPGLSDSIQPPTVFFQSTANADLSAVLQTDGHWTQAGVSLLTKAGFTGVSTSLTAADIAHRSPGTGLGATIRANLIQGAALTVHAGNYQHITLANIQANSDDPSAPINTTGYEVAFLNDLRALGVEGLIEQCALTSDASCNSYTTYPEALAAKAQRTAQQQTLTALRGLVSDQLSTQEAGVCRNESATLEARSENCATAAQQERNKARIDGIASLLPESLRTPAAVTCRDMSQPVTTRQTACNTALQESAPPPQTTYVRDTIIGVESLALVITLLTKRRPPTTHESIRMNNIRTNLRETLRTEFRSLGGADQLEKYPRHSGWWASKKAAKALANAIISEWEREARGKGSNGISPLQMGDLLDGDKLTEAAIGGYVTTIAKVSQNTPLRALANAYLNHNPTNKSQGQPPVNRGAVTTGLSLPAPVATKLTLKESDVAVLLASVKKRSDNDQEGDARLIIEMIEDGLTDGTLIDIKSPPYIVDGKLTELGLLLFLKKLKDSGKINIHIFFQAYLDNLLTRFHNSGGGGNPPDDKSKDLKDKISKALNDHLEPTYGALGNVDEKDPSKGGLSLEELLEKLSTFALSKGPHQVTDGMDLNSETLNKLIRAFIKAHSATPAGRLSSKLLDDIEAAAATALAASSTTTTK